MSDEMITSDLHIIKLQFEHMNGNVDAQCIDADKGMTSVFGYGVAAWSHPNGNMIKVYVAESAYNGLLRKCGFDGAVMRTKIEQATQRKVIGYMKHGGCYLYGLSLDKITSATDGE